MSSLLLLFGRSAAPASIGGIAVGTAGTSGIYNGYTLAGGDDFASNLDVMGIGNPLGRYIPVVPFGAGARVRPAPNTVRFYSDPYTTGAQDANKGVPVGFTNLSQAASKVTLQAVRTTAGQNTATGGKTIAVANLMSGTNFVFTAPCIFEGYISHTAVATNPEGWHATLWVQNVSPMNVTGANTPGWVEFDHPETSSQYGEANFNVWGTTTGPGSNSTSLQPDYTMNGSFHLWSLVLTATDAKYYLDGVLKKTVAQDCTNTLKPYAFWLTSSTYNAAYAGDTGVNDAAWAADANGATLIADYVRVWLPNATASQVMRPLQALPIQQVDFNTSFSYVFPSTTALWGSGVVDSDYPEAARLEDFEPGSATDGNTAYTRFPSAFSYNSGTRTLSGTVTDRPGRLHLICTPYKAGGSLGYVARGYLDVGPNITTTTMNATNGVLFSRDLYQEMDCGTLVPKVMTVTGPGGGALPAGITFNSTTGVLSGTPTVTATTALTLTVTNSSGQSATSNVNFAVASAAVLALGNSATNSTTTQTTPVTVTAAAGDIIVLHAFTNQAAGSTPVTGITDTLGLTWTRRTAQVWNAGGNNTELWWAYAPAGGSNTITTTFTAAANYANRCSVFCVAGANTTTPFDTNVSLPAVSTSVSGAQTRSVTISTTNADTFLFGVLAEVGGSLTISARPSGYAQILTTGTVNDISKRIVSAAQSSVAQAWTWTGSAPTASILVVDAIQKA